MLSSFSSALVIGYFFAYTTVFAEIIVLYDFPQTDSYYLGASFLLAGIFGGILTSIILTKHPIYK